MKVYQVTDRESGYDGSGLVMAAIKDGKAVKLAYLRDICADYDPCDGEESLGDWPAYRDRPECSRTAAEFSQFGQVVAGMASCWEVVKL